MMSKLSRLMLQRISLSGTLMGAMAILAGCSSGPPPTAQMEVSKAAVERASTIDTAEYAPAELQSAKDKLARARQAMQQEHYELARQLAEEAQVDAQLAEAKSQSVKAQKAARDSQESIRTLREEINRKTQ